MTIRLDAGHYIGALCASLAIASLAQAQEYPSKPIRLVVPTSAGLVDSLARLFAGPTGERLGQPMIVENRPGGGTIIALESVARAPADGYTLIVGTSELGSMPAVKKKLPFDPIKDFTPVALVVSSWTVFAINQKLPINNLHELVSYAKAKPGSIRFGSSGVGGALHLAGEMLRLKTGAELIHVPYKGGAQVVADTIGGQIEMASVGLASVVARRSQLRVLAQTGPVRHSTLPDVPTTAELGMPEVLMETWFGVLGPANIPRPIVARLSREIGAVVEQPAFDQKLATMGMATAFMPPERFSSYIVDEVRRWSKLMPALGIEPEL